MKDIFGKEDMKIKLNRYSIFNKHKHKNTVCSYCNYFYLFGFSCHLCPCSVTHYNMCAQVHNVTYVCS